MKEISPQSYERLMFIEIKKSVPQKHHHTNKLTRGILELFGHYLN